MGCTNTYHTTPKILIRGLGGVEGGPWTTEGIVVRERGCVCVCALARPPAHPPARPPVRACLRACVLVW